MARHKMGGWEGRPSDTVSAAVDHSHDVSQVQTFDHHLHEVLVAASAGHKLLQGQLAWGTDAGIKQKIYQRIHNIKLNEHSNILNSNEINTALYLSVFFPLVFKMSLV